jgi:hypothetical protein
VHLLILVFILLMLAEESVRAAPGPPPPGYEFVKISNAVASSVSGIQQLAFKPGDTTHVYASRGFSRTVTRYDYNPTTGQLSNAVTVANLNGVSDGMGVITGLGFHGNDMWITRWPGYVVPRPTAVSRLRDGNGDGAYETLSTFATGMNVGDHNITQVQIRGNSLYTGIGVVTNTGDPDVEQSYNGTIARIADLNNPVSMNLANASDRNTFADSSVPDGRLRRFARGFRNPYGMRFDSTGTLWVTDNGADDEGSFPETPDWLYDNVPHNSVGRFPPPGQPGGTSPTTEPLAHLGLHSAPTGFEFIPSGPHRGDVLVGTAASAGEGRRLIHVESVTGYPSTFMSGFNITTDVVRDPFGRLLIADFNDNAIYLLSPPPDGDANLDRQVDVSDLGVLASNWQSFGGYAQGDFDRSGFIDISDLGILASNWQADADLSFPQALAAAGLQNVPEPGAATGLAAATICSLKRPRRWRCRCRTTLVPH